MNPAGERPEIPDPMQSCSRCRESTGGCCPAHSSRIYYREGNEGRYRLVWVGPVGAQP